MPKGYQFDKRSVDRIADAVRKVESMPPINPRRGAIEGGPLWTHVVLPSTNIPAVSEDGAGVGPGTLYKLGSTGDFVSLTDESTFYNLGTVAASSNDFLPCFRDAGSGKWMIATNNTGEILWGKVERNWISGSYNYVRVNPCNDKAGTGATAAIVNVYLPAVANRDPNLVTDDVIVYAITESGEAVCMSDYNDDSIGTVKMQDSTVVVDGWEIFNYLKGRFPLGADDVYAITTSGGSTSHLHALGGADPIPDRAGGGTNAPAAPAGNSPEVSHMPPYRVVAFVRRIDNSGTAP